MIAQSGIVLQVEQRTIEIFLRGNLALRHGGNPN